MVSKILKVPITFLLCFVRINIFLINKKSTYMLTNKECLFEIDEKWL